jgi:hyperosmotically inducible periplasmic protein
MKFISVITEEFMRQPNRKPFRSSAILLFSLLLTLGSASGAFAAPPKKDPPPAVDSANYEAWLSNQVRHNLVMISFYSVFDNLEYRVEGTKVTLLGEVVNPVVADDAKSAVKHIEGVEAVDNKIEVLPPSRFDDQIRRAEFRAIYSYPGLQMYSLRSVPTIHIIVKNSNVTLEGAVATQADKNVAGIRANEVPNVFSVTNNLRVDNAS